MRATVYILVILFAVSVFCQDAVAQYDYDIESGNDTATNILLKKEYTFGVVLHNLGMGGNWRKGTNRSFFKTRIFEIELVSMKHPKQIRVINPYYYNAKSYVYGKMNHVYMLRATMGNKVLLNRKPYWGGVEVRYFYQGGLSLAFLKPVYLYFWDDTYSVIEEERYNPDNYWHSSEYIYGRAPYLSGFSEISVSPGIVVKGGLNFEFGEIQTKIRALEAGIVAEFFGIPIPIMAYNPEQRFFITFYLAFQFGKRYNRY